MPLCHIFERIIIYMYYYSRVEIYFAESLETISENLKEVRPFYMTAVPRLIEKIFDKIESKAEGFTGIKKSLYKWSISIADRFSIERQNGNFYNLKLKLAKFLVFSKWKSALGGRLELICSEVHSSTTTCKNFHSCRNSNHGRVWTHRNITSNIY